ncbi:MAG: hypothetical protein N2444_10825, partial [Methylocystis sp.]|nr:hypothetical protein [Methylocystis sp.]
VILDYARYYGLRTAGVFAPTDASRARPESFALDAIITDNAELLRESWRAQQLDLAYAPFLVAMPKRDLSIHELRDLLATVPPVTRLFMLSGSHGAPTNIIQDCAHRKIDALSLQWNDALAALAPSPAEESALSGLIASDVWSLLPLDSCRDGAEAMAIVDEAKGLGLKIAIIVGDYVIDRKYGRLPLQGADLVLFPTEEKREAALSDAFRLDEKVALLRERWRVGADLSGWLAAIFSCRERLSSPRLLNSPKSIWTMDLDLRAEIEKLGIAIADTDASFADWMLLFATDSETLTRARQARARGAKIAVIAGAMDDANKAAACEAMAEADVVLPTSWQAAADIIRALSLAGKTATKIIPCPQPTDFDNAVGKALYA